MSNLKWVIVEKRNYRALRGLSFKTETEAKAYIVEKYNERIRNRFGVESRIIKDDDTELRMHCQCCQRAILANLGTIAHHGYERPDHGWQTASCMGAKRLPWEVDRTALGEMIKYLRERLARAIKHRAAIKNETSPIVFGFESHFIGPLRYRPHTWPTVQRTFDVTRTTFTEFKSDVGRNATYGRDYDRYKAEHIGGLTNSIDNLRNHINEEQARYDDWKPTHQRIGDQWQAL